MDMDSSCCKKNRKASIIMKSKNRTGIEICALRECIIQKKEFPMVLLSQHISGLGTEQMQCQVRDSVASWNNS